MAVNVSKLIEKGEEALKKHNHDYAISILLEAVSFAPDNRKARELLRKAELKKYERSYPSSLVVAFTGMGARIGMFFAGMGRKKNPEGYMMACEKFLAKDPKNKKVNMQLGAAAADAGHLQAAIYAYETAAESDPADVTALKRLGDLLWRAGEITKAHDMFDRVVRLNPRDQEAVKARKNLAAEASLKQTGFETAQSSLDLVKDKDAAGRLEREQRLHRTEEDLDAERVRLEKQLAEAPEDTDAMEELAGCLRKLRDYDGAIALYDRAVKRKPDDVGLQFRRGDLQMLKFEEELGALRRAGDREAAKAKEAAFDHFRAEEYARRVKAHPTDLRLRFRLGEMLFKLGELEDAITQFQQTVRDPKYKSDSQLRLGLAFAAKGQTDLAVRQLRSALEDQTGMSDRVKEIRYALGDVYMTSGDVAKAKEEFGSIYEVDIGFRDVADRLATLSGNSEQSRGEGKLSLS